MDWRSAICKAPVCSNSERWRRYSQSLQEPEWGSLRTLLQTPLLQTMPFPVFFCNGLLNTLEVFLLISVLFYILSSLSIKTCQISFSRNIFVSVTLPFHSANHCFLASTHLEWLDYILGSSSHNIPLLQLHFVLEFPLSAQSCSLSVTYFHFTARLLFRFTACHPIYFTSCHLFHYTVCHPIHFNSSLSFCQLSLRVFHQIVPSPTFRASLIWLFFLALMVNLYVLCTPGNQQTHHSKFSYLFLPGYQ